MRTSFGRYVLAAYMGLILLAGCAESREQFGAPGGAAGQGMPTLAGRTHAKSSSGGDLLYVSSYRLDTVYVYSYPNIAFVDKLTTDFDGTMGLCSDDAGDVFITNLNTNDVVEYAHGGTVPVATLTENPSQGSGPRGCAIDPITGDLAVANSGTGNDVAIFPEAQGTPKYYKPADIYSAYFCGYDSQGDLFVDGTSHGPSSGFAFAELTKGGGSFRRLKLNRRIEQPGAVQWDGSYMTIGSVGREHSEIYRVKLSGSKVIVAGTTSLKGAKEIGQFLIQGSKVVAPYATHRDSVTRVGLWDYPETSGVQELLRINGMSLYGVAISATTSH